MYTREYKKNCLGSVELNKECMSNVVTMEKSLVHEFYIEEQVSKEDGSPMLQVSDPIYLLFNQQRLNSIGAGAVQMWIQQMSAVTSNPLAELRKQCSDDDLLTMVKSRHIQSPSELLAWAQFMTANMDKFQTEVAKLVAAKQADIQADESQSKIYSADNSQQVTN